MTKSQRMRESAVMISSTIPSTKYSCSGSPLMLAKGNTAIEGLSGSGSAAHRIDDAGKFHQHAVAGGLDDAAVVLGDLRIEKLAAQRFEAFERALLVRPHQPRIPRHISGEDRGETAGPGHQALTGHKR